MGVLSVRDMPSGIGNEVIEVQVAQVRRPSTRRRRQRKTVWEKLAGSQFARDLEKGTVFFVFAVGALVVTWWLIEFLVWFLSLVASFAR